MIKSCEQCGVAFDARGRAKTCSTECSAANQSAYMTRFRADAEFQLRRRMSRRAPAVTKACEECGVAFQASGTARTSLTCSEECRVASKRRKQRTRFAKWYGVAENRDRMRVTAAKPEHVSRTRQLRSTTEYRQRENARRSSPEARAARSAYWTSYYERRQTSAASRMLALLRDGGLAEVGSEPYFVYRLFSASGALLYVGITNDVNRRVMQHAKGKPWFIDVADIDVAPFANKTEARAAEAYLIQSCRPTHNILSNYAAPDVGTAASDLLRRFKRDAIDVEQAKRAA